jgi:hypothetical protein
VKSESKEKRQKSNTNIKRTCLSASDLAAPTDKGCKSDMRPFPMGDAKKGIFVVSTNFSNSAPARAYAAPLPE